MPARKPAPPPQSALDQLPAMFEAGIAELSDSEAAMIRNALRPRELPEFDAARNVAAKRSGRA